MKKLLDYLRLGEVKDLEGLDSTAVSLLQANIIRKKPFLKRLYVDFYKQLKLSIPGDISSKSIVELGSGGGFIKELIPQAVTSDVIPLPHVDKNFSVFNMPFGKNTVDVFLMLNVFHHISDASSFLKEIERCLKSHGRVIMIEPANTFWGRIIWKNFHHEPFDPEGGWSFEGSDPIFSANEALPWIVFCRDRERLHTEFPSLKVLSIKPHSPLSYIVSGGVSMKQLLPSCLYHAVRAFEMILSPFNRYLGMFMTIEIEKT